MITDKLASYGAAKREVMPGIEHRQHKGLNNRAENSHQPTRRRERQMKQFKSAGQAQRSVAAVIVLTLGQAVLAQNKPAAPAAAPATTSAAAPAVVPAADRLIKEMSAYIGSANELT